MAVSGRKVERLLIGLMALTLAPGVSRGGDSDWSRHPRSKQSTQRPGQRPGQRVGPLGVATDDSVPQLQWETDASGWSEVDRFAKLAGTQHKELLLEFVIDRSKESRQCVQETSREPEKVKALWAFEQQSRKLELEIAQSAPLKKTLVSYLLVRVNGRTACHLANYYRITSYPTMLLIHPDWFEIPTRTIAGSTPEVVSRIEGVWGASALIGELELAFDDARDYPSMLAAFQSNHDLEAAGRLAEISIRRGAPGQAQRYLTEGLSQDPENSHGVLTRALHVVGESYIADGHYALARKCFDLAIKTSHDAEQVAALELDLAINEIAQGHYELGAKQLKTVIDSPDFPLEFRDRAQSLLKWTNLAQKEEIEISNIGNDSGDGN